MRAGVSFPSYAADPTYAMVAGTANASYPVQNLSDLYNIRTPFQSNGIGNVSFSFVFTATKSLQLLALLHHNGTAGSTIRWRLYSDAAMTAQVYDSSALPLFPTGSAPSSLYPQCFPLKIGATSARAGRVDLAGNDSAWSVGAVELSGWWEWTDVAVPRSLGVQNSDIVAQQPFGVDHTMGQFAPRIVQGTRELTDQSENSTTALDFQLEKKTSRPFVFCTDVSDPTTYPRECLLVRNARLLPPTMTDYPSGKQGFQFLEHVR